MKRAQSIRCLQDEKAEGEDDDLDKHHDPKWLRVQMATRAADANETVIN